MYVLLRLDSQLNLIRVRVMVFNANFICDMIECELTLQNVCCDKM